MKTTLESLRILIFLTVLTGVIYPLAMTALAAAFFPQSSKASLVSRDGKQVGSALIAQEFKDPKYFWSRPSAGGYNPLPSGGSNQGPTSETLKKAVAERRAALMQAQGSEVEPPQDLLFASSSGLDPHISPAAAHYQAGRVAKARGLDLSAVENLVIKHTEKRQLGVFGEPRVNVLLLNLDLDRTSSIAPTQ